MSWITLSRREGFCYLFVRLPFRQALEVGVQDLQRLDPPIRAHFNMGLRFNVRGHDHAGFKLFIEFWCVFFEFNVYDTRHWNYAADRWALGPAETARDGLVDCDEGYDSRWLHGHDANPSGLGSTLYDKV